MANLGKLRSRFCRTPVGLVAAFALLLPLPARCASCAASHDQCPRCSAAKAGDQGSPTDSVRSCCQHRSETPATDNGVSGEQSHPLCGCGFESAPRNTQPTAKASITADVMAAAPALATIPSNLNAAGASATATSIASLPPPIPHRILHCSWII
jgi:hypothetical protein